MNAMRDDGVEPVVEDEPRAARRVERARRHLVGRERRVRQEAEPRVGARTPSASRP